MQIGIEIIVFVVMMTGDIANTIWISWFIYFSTILSVYLIF